MVSTLLGIKSQLLAVAQEAQEDRPIAHPGDTDIAGVVSEWWEQKMGHKEARDYPGLW